MGTRDAGAGLRPSVHPRQQGKRHCTVHTAGPVCRGGGWRSPEMAAISGRVFPLGAHGRPSTVEPPVLRPHGLPGGGSWLPRPLSRRGWRRKPAQSWACGPSELGGTVAGQRGALCPPRGMPNGHLLLSSRPLPDERFLLRILAGWEAALGWGARRPSVSWHAGNIGAQWAGPWLSRTSRSFPSYHRCRLGAPGARARSRFTIKVIVSHIQRGSDVHCGRGQREASRDAGRGTQGLGGHRPVAEPHPVCDCIGPGSTTGNAATHKPRRLPLLSFTPF